MVRRAKWARKKHRSIDTASKIISIRKAHPDWSLPEIGAGIKCNQTTGILRLKEGRTTD